jgi:hypothetical protein
MPTVILDERWHKRRFLKKARKNFWELGELEGLRLLGKGGRGVPSANRFHLSAVTV